MERLDQQNSVSKQRKSNLSKAFYSILSSIESRYLIGCISVNLITGIIGML